MRLAWLHFRLNAMNEFQYRVNFAIQIVQSLVAVTTGLVVLSLVFRQTSNLDGWAHSELLVVMGVYTIVGGFLRFGIQPNMAKLVSDVQLGNLDYVLTKPVDAQLLSSVREFRLWQLTDVGVGMGVLIYGLASGDAQLGPLAVWGFGMALAAGLIMIYCVWLLLSLGAFWFVRMEMLQELFVGLYRAGQYPVTIYPGWLRAGLTFLIPIGFAVTTPAEWLTGRITVRWMILSFGFCVFLWMLTRRVWTAGIRRYSGASA